MLKDTPGLGGKAHPFLDDEIVAALRGWAYGPNAGLHFKRLGALLRERGYKPGDSAEHLSWDFADNMYEIFLGAKTLIGITEVQALVNCLAWLTFRKSEPETP